MAPLIFKTIEEDKKPSLSKNRGLEEDLLNKHFAEMIAKCGDVTIKAVLLKVRVKATFEVNVTALKAVDGKHLAAALEFLAGVTEHAKDSGDLVKDGLVFALLVEIARRLPYKCSTCLHEVLNLHETPVKTVCKMCGIGACQDCHSNSTGETTGSAWSFLCPPCEITTVGLKAIPNKFFKVKFRKISLADNPSNDTVPPHDETEVRSDDDSESDDEDDKLQAGQASGSPSLNAFPVSQPSGTSLVIPEVTPEVAEGDGDKFQEPNARLKKKRKTMKRASAAEAANIQHSQPKVPCRFYLAGGCRYGFLGKTPKDGVKECPHPHPDICRNYLNNGNMAGGCRKGTNCDSKHPKMCPESLRTRTCSKIKGGSRCPQGYHLRGTKSVSKPAERKPGASQPAKPPTKVNPPAKSSQTTEETRTQLASFLGDLIRVELKALLMPSPRALPEAPQPPSQGSPANQDSLASLLASLLRQ